jgi:ABC-2 type transport system ATP-binding protein
MTDCRNSKILEIVGLTPADDRRSGEFSTGMKQRLGLGMALLYILEQLTLVEHANLIDPK